MRLLCFGKDGLLGSELQLWLDQVQPESCVWLGKQDCDITDADAVDQVFQQYKPTVVMNAVAYTLVDDAEDHADTANAVNHIGVQHIVAGCKAHGATLVHFSTDYVFDGTQTEPYTEDCAVGPINVYGQTKQDAEAYIMGALEAYYILRIQWIFGTKKPNFMSAILKKAKEGGVLRVVNDQFGSPTSTTTVSKAVVNLLVNMPAHGVYHFRTLQHTTWYDVAVFICAQCGLDVEIEGVDTSVYPTKAMRPKNTVLNIGKWIYTDLYTPPMWTQDVKDYLKNKGYIKE